MLQLLNEGWSEHDLVRAKWADIITILELGRGLIHPIDLTVGAENCAYCELYIDDDCIGCPIGKGIKRIRCRNTPFRYFGLIWVTICGICDIAPEGCNYCEHYPKLLKAVWTGYEFLLSLNVQDHVKA